jgi:hypothetical protein
VRLLCNTACQKGTAYAKLAASCPQRLKLHALDWGGADTSFGGIWPHSISLLGCKPLEI